MFVREGPYLYSVFVINDGYTFLFEKIILLLILDSSVPLVDSLRAAPPPRIIR